MFKWFKKFMEKKEKQGYENGYNYAAGNLLSGNKSLDELHDDVIFAREFGLYTSFEDGMLKAMSDFENLLNR